MRLTREGLCRVDGCGTHSENSVDMHRKGRGRANLTPSDVLAIRADTRLQREIAADYGVTQATISKVQRQDTWSFL